MTAYSQISVTRLAELARQGNIDVIDVRTPVEFRASRASIARNAPLDSLDPSAIMHSRRDMMHEPLYVMCRGGNRSSKACQKFVDAGFSNVVNVEGGLDAWERAGLTMAGNPQVISLERQVRIAAGSLILIGIALGYFVHPYFIGVSAFVGAGLVFAGITNTCGMGLLLANMPWNQSHDQTPTCAR